MITPPTITAFTKWPEGSSLDPHEIQAVVGWHCVGDSGPWDIERLSAILGENLVASHQSGHGPAGSTGIPRYRYLVFAKEPQLLIGYTPHTSEFGLLRVWARDPAKANEEFARLRDSCLRKDSAQKPDSHFYLLTVKMGDVEARLVRRPPTILGSEDLRLHYGEDFESWHHQFVAELRHRQHGLTILQGPPGTGKTTYLRNLLYQLRESHAFYYLPLPVYSFLSSPACVDFWIDQNERHEDLTKVVVLEDAEALLAERHAENQESLSTLLNIGDGFLGDFLQMHVICTMNSPIGRLDPAIKRSGRLIAAQQFERLTWPRAERLARAKGFQLEKRETYSLAEIYRSSSLAAQITETNERQVGFAA